MKPCRNGHASKRGAANRCLECQRASLKRHRIKYPERHAEQSKRYYAENPERYQEYTRNRNPIKLMLREARGRAKEGGYPCTITEADIHIPDRCPLLDLELRRGVKVSGPCSPTLDKIRPELGYVPGNVWVISRRANAIKHDASLEEIERLAYNLRKFMRFPWET